MHEVWFGQLDFSKRLKIRTPASFSLEFTGQLLPGRERVGLFFELL